MVAAASPDDSQQDPPAKPRKSLVRLTDVEWVAARFQYETGQLSVAQLMAKYNVAERTIRIRIAEQGWKVGSQVADGAERHLQQLIADRLPATADAIALKVGQRMEENLAPWFEREKRKWVKESVKIAKAGRQMVRNLVSNLEDSEAGVTSKDAAYIAKTDDIYDNIGRRNLGMSDGAGVAGNLNVQILTGQAAVQVNQS